MAVFPLIIPEKVAAITSINLGDGNEAVNLAKKYGVSMPITEQLDKVLFHGSNVKEALGMLMSRPKKAEMELVL